MYLCSETKKPVENGKGDGESDQMEEEPPLDEKGVEKVCKSYTLSLP